MKPGCEVAVAAELQSARPVAGSPYADLAERLRAARERQELSLASVARALEVTGPAVAHWEKCIEYPSAPNLVQWAAALGLHLVVADLDGQVLASGRPVPRRNEPVELYRLRCLTGVLRAERLRSDVTQETIGDRLCVSAWTVQMWEGGRRLPRVPRLIAWCQVLNCRINLAQDA